MFMEKCCPLRRISSFRSATSRAPKGASIFYNARNYKHSAPSGATMNKPHERLTPTQNLPGHHSIACTPRQIESAGQEFEKRCCCTCSPGYPAEKITLAHFLFAEICGSNKVFAH